MSGRDGAASVIYVTREPYHNFSSWWFGKHPQTRHCGWDTYLFTNTNTNTNTALWIVYYLVLYVTVVLTFVYKYYKVDGSGNGI